jgi:hypothetical protein
VKFSQKITCELLISKGSGLLNFSGLEVCGIFWLLLCVLNIISPVSSSNRASILLLIC